MANGLTRGDTFFTGRTAREGDEPGQRFLTNIPSRAEELGGGQIEAMPSPRGLLPPEQRTPAPTRSPQQERENILAWGRENRKSPAEVMEVLKLQGVETIKPEVPAAAGKTIETAEGIKQWNPETNRYDIHVGVSKGKGEGGVEAEIDLARRTKEAEATGKGIGTRRQATIDKGLTASEGYANLVRAKDLLDQLDTGGVNAISLRAKQLFGVEGANEAELSNRLSKAVLSQLRATFGAAFTAQEGAKLERIEAGYGKSTEGNKRIINQSMKIVEAAAQRGIRAAEKAGDTESADNIREALAFTLATVTPPAETGGATTQEGATATNPTTGAKIVFRGGQWQPI